MEFKKENVMNHVVIDQDLRNRLNGLDKHATFCDEAGQPLGIFIPATDKAKLAYVKVPFTEEEIQRRMQEKGGCTLPEIWEKLKKS